MSKWFHNMRLQKNDVKHLHFSENSRNITYVPYVWHVKSINEVLFMSIQIGINGFGRIGRMVMRASIDHPEIKIVGINDLCPADYLAYMLKYDTMHGKFNAEVSSKENAIIVNGQEIPVFAERNPADLPWDIVGAEYIVESTGLFLTKEKAQAHLTAGAKKVIMSAPSKDDNELRYFTATTPGNLQKRQSRLLS